MILDYIMFMKYFMIKNWLVKIVNKAIMLSISLDKIKLTIKIKRYIRSIVLTDILHIS